MEILVDDQFDNYRWIHKAVRHQMIQVILRLSTTDWGDAGERDEVLNAVDRSLNSQVDHTRHEETYYHPMLESRAPGSTRRFSIQHKEIEERIDRLKKKIAVLQNQANVVESKGLEIYLTYCRFAADYMVHLDEEDAELKPLFLKHFSEVELLELQSRVVADVSPEEMQVILPNISAALDRIELVAWLSQIQQNAPAEIFTEICSVASRNIVLETWEKVREALGLESDR